MTPPPPVAAMLARGAVGGITAGELHALTGHCRDLLRPPAAGDAVVALLRDMAAAAMQHQPAARGLACRRGCDHCCHQQVSAHAVEVFAMARVLRGRVTVPPPRGRACPMLGQERDCTIHAERPLACRMFVSTDVAACARAFAAGGAPDSWPQPIIDTSAWMLMALWAAQLSLGLPILGYPLGPALAAVLADPGLEARWLAGDDGLARFAGPEHHPHPAMRAAVEQLARDAGL